MQPRSHDDSRLRSRAIEFTGVAVIALCLAGGVLAMVQQALAWPMAHVAAALGG
jgi:hypothetical protein